eukprot:1433724-Rhodomonas_salina.1
MMRTVTATLWFAPHAIDLTPLRPAQRPGSLTHAPSVSIITWSSVGELGRLHPALSGPSSGRCFRCCGHGATRHRHRRRCFWSGSEPLRTALDCIPFPVDCASTAQRVAVCGSQDMCARKASACHRWLDKEELKTAERKGMGLGGQNSREDGRKKTGLTRSIESICWLIPASCASSKVCVLLPICPW